MGFHCRIPLLVKVAMVDTGLDVNHPEFKDRVILTQNFKDPGTDSSNVFDDSGHGTATTGIVAAQGNNGIGIAGMAWDVRIMAFRACGGASLDCSLADEIQAIDAARTNGAQVINLSLGGVVRKRSAEQLAIVDAYNAGIVLVAAAGNGNPGKYYKSTGNPTQDMQTLFYPAAYPQVIGVAALDDKGGSIVDPGKLTRASFSNYGEDLVSVCAVGTEVETTVPWTQERCSVRILRDARLFQARRNQFRVPPGVRARGAHFVEISRNRRRRSDHADRAQCPSDGRSGCKR